MKIVCEACQAKYSIADDKVRGKVFKIRCKKCSHVIVVRGTGEGAAASGELAAGAPAQAGGGSEPAWHIVVDGEQVGPLPESDVRGRLVRGEISPDTFIWKEGLADWAKISTLPEFASGEESSAPFNGGAAAGEHNPFAQTTSVYPPGAASAFAAASSGEAKEPDLFSAPSAGAGSAVPDLFASQASSGGDGGATGVSASPFAGGDSGAPSVDPFMGARSLGNGAGGAVVSGSGLTGQRHENSVLFSLSNLEALAKPSAAPIPSAPRPSTSSTTEGSGLIDIRAMANMTLGSSGASASGGGGNDLPAFSAPQFSPVAPVLLPVSPSSGPPKWAVILLVVFGVVAVGLTILVIKVLSSSPTVAPPVAQPPVAVPTAPIAATPPPVAKPEPPPTTPPPADEKLPPRVTAKGTEPAATPDKAERPGKKEHGTKKSGKASADNGEHAAAAPTPTKPERPEAPAKPTRTDDIDSLLAAAAGTKKVAKRDDDDAPRPSQKLERLTQEEVVKGMSSVVPKARDCYNQFKVPGTVLLKVTVDQRGKVSSAVVGGKFAGTPSGACVESAVKTAKFAPSTGLTFDYPIPLR